MPMTTPDYLLYHGDCLTEMDKIPDKSIDAIIADLPYGEVNRTSNGLRNLDKGAADVMTFDLAELQKYINRLTDCFHLFCGTEQVSEIRRNAVRDGWSTRLFVWEKTNPSPMNGEHIWLSGIECAVYGKRNGATFNEFCANPVWRGASVHDQVHPTEKPLSLFEYLVKTYTNPGDTVLDCTMGSGTTGAACGRLNRRFIGIEKDGDYFAIAQNRIQNAYGDYVRTPEEVKRGQLALFEVAQ